VVVAAGGSAGDSTVRVPSSDRAAAARDANVQIDFEGLQHES
jgi:hypothetical protein